MKYLSSIKKQLLGCAFSIGFLIPFAAGAQQLVYPVWDVHTYPDEVGFQQRISGMIARLASKGFGDRSRSVALCPDTQMPVYSWAMEGEEIMSPYTGRRFKQGPTGYFGVKQRDSLGRIIAFGGDPLKYDLPPTTAALMLDPQDQKAKQFLKIPGNWRQQYHFAAKNWVRFYGLIGFAWDSSWQKDFREAIAQYAESRRPSDGIREHSPMSRPHNLIGERGELLGGNTKDGGTENHKTMWRTSALVYAQWFPKEALISNVPVDEAARLTDSMLNDYVKRLAYTGNGEYDSQMYYPHSIGAFLNVFDFSKTNEYRTLAQTALDYYLITYGLKVYDGAIAGAQKRGFLPEEKSNEMELYLRTWGAEMSRIIPLDHQIPTIHQLTSAYRPNRVIMDVLNKNVTLPFEAFMNRPSYHMNERSRFQETFYASKSFGIGSVAFTMVDNPVQQTVWSLVAKGKEGPLAFGAMHPLYLNPTGHSPYTQTLQKKGALIVATGPSRFEGEPRSASQQERRKYAATPLHDLAVPDPGFSRQQWRTWLEQSKQSSSTWLFIPRNGTKVDVKQNGISIEANQTYLFIQDLGDRHFWISPPDSIMNNLPDKDPLRIFSQYNVLASVGPYSGFVVQAAEASDHLSIESFVQKMIVHTKLDRSQWKRSGYLQYRSLQGDVLTMQYDPSDLRCKGMINGRPLNYSNWAEGAVYQSPYVTIKDGMMHFSNGREAYSIDCRGERPKFIENQNN